MHNDDAILDDELKHDDDDLDPELLEDDLDPLFGELSFEDVSSEDDTI